MSRIEPVPLALPCPGRALGPDEPVFVVAEAGVNHNGSLRTALRLVRAAADAGADAVKFQTFRTDRLVRSGTRTAAYQRAATGEKDQAAMLRKLELSEADFRRVAEECRAAQILFVSTPFDEESLRFVAGLGMPFLKIGSGDLTNLPLLREGARTGLPLVISTGMADLADIDAARRCLSGSAARGAWNRTVLLHCVSQYPTPLEQANVRAVPALAGRYGRPAGFSDHTLGSAAAFAAVALGACLIEKHLTLDRDLAGPDHKASSTPEEFKALVKGIREARACLGTGEKIPTDGERQVRAVARRGTYAVRALQAGQFLRGSDVEFRRPEAGLSPVAVEEYFGRRLERPVRAGEAVTAGHFSPASPGPRRTAGGRPRGGDRR